MNTTKVTLRKQKIRKDHTKLKFVLLLSLALLLILLAAVSPKIVPYDPYEQNLELVLKAPSAEHIFGTDQYGRDLFSRVIAGSRISIFSVLLLVCLNTFIGTAAGVICGYYGKKTDAVIMRISDVFLAFPGMVFAIAVAGVMGGGIMNAVFALACISWPKFARIARSQVMTVKNMPFMAAAQMTGSGTFKIIRKHILPNIAGPVLVTAVLDIGTMMMELAGLSFLGLGATPPAAEWGSMMSSGRSLLQTSPWAILAPGAAIFITVMIFNLLGDTVRDLLDTRQRRK